MRLYQAHFKPGRSDAVPDAHARRKETGSAARKETGSAAQGGAGGKRRQEGSSLSDKSSIISDKGPDGCGAGGVDGIPAWSRRAWRPGSAPSSTSSQAEPASTSSAGQGVTSGQAVAHAPLTFTREQLLLIESIIQSCSGMGTDGMARRCAAALNMTPEVPLCGFVGLGLFMPAWRKAATVPVSDLFTYTHIHILLAPFLAPPFRCLIFPANCFRL